MPSLQMLSVALRRLLARRPWIHWLVVLAAALATGVTLRQRMAGIDEARRGWGDAREVFVARRDTAPGEPLEVDVRQVPAAIVPQGALDRDMSTAQLIARQDVSAGEIVTAIDVGRTGQAGPQALLPDGWAAVPIVESPAAGAAIGARVQVVGDGLVLAPDAIVVGYHDDVTLVAVPAGAAPMVAAGAEAGGVAVLLLP
ncbi:MAG TPA: hypothetical protein VF065_00825 [Ilumatobacter sp.]